MEFKKIFVTGGAGYVGSCLVPNLLSKNYEVTVYDIMYYTDKYLPKENKNLKVIKGGVAYNCSANSKLLKSGLYKNIFIQPAAGDSGGALGAALGLDFIISGKKRANFSHVYLGKSFSDQEIRSYLDNNGIAYKFHENFDLLCDDVSDEIANEKIVGWFQGSFEFGPRSLGNRSILADPRYFKNKKIVNSKIKFRELFRPFAPSSLKEFASIYYELNEHEIEQQPYSFMLSTVKVREEYKDTTIINCVLPNDGSPTLILFSFTYLPSDALSILSPGSYISIS